VVEPGGLIVERVRWLFRGDGCPQGLTTELWNAFRDGLSTSGYHMESGACPSPGTSSTLGPVFGGQVKGHEGIVVAEVMSV